MHVAISSPGKMFRPPLPADHLPRPELVRLIQDAAQCRVVLICAPAGAGKSTLAAEVAEQLPDLWLSAWLALERRDAAPAQMLRSLIEALQALFPGVGAAELALLAQQQTHQPLAIEPLIACLVSELERHNLSQQSVLLILDDYHLARNAATDSLCALLFERLPASFQVLITSRGRPTWPLGRMRLANQVLELDERQLRLPPECARIFLERAGVDVADRQWLRQRIERNEGWFAGLRLLALTAGSGEPQATVSEEQLVQEYLLEEVIGGQPVHVQEFLSQIIWLDHFTPELCDQVRNASDSRVIIDWLLEHQVFLVPLDRQSTWYRFHHLFCDVLRQRGAAQGLPARQGVHLRACDWFREHGRIADAVEQALAAERPDEAAALAQHLPLDQLLAEQHVSTLLRWKAILPRVLQGSSARLVLVHGWTLALACQLEDARVMLARLAFFLPQPDAASQRRLLGQALALQSYVARAAGDLGEASQCAQHSLQCLNSEDVGSQLMSMLTLADIALCEENIDASRGWARTALELAQRSANVLFEAQVVLVRARLLQARGQVARACRMLGQQLEVLNKLDYPQGLAIRARLTILHGYYVGQLGDSEAARREVRQGIDEARSCRDIHVLPGYCLLAGIEARRRDGFNQAFELLAEAERLMHQWDVPPVFYLGWGTALKSDLWISAGRQELAEQWLPRLRQTYCLEEPAAPPSFFHVLPVVIERVYARLLWGRGEQRQAEALLWQVLERLQLQGERLQALSVMTQLVQMLGRSQRRAQAQQLLLRAIVWAADDTIVGPFLPLISHMPVLVQRTLQNAPPSRLKLRLQEKLPMASQAPESGLVEPLSSRELAVLECIARGHSNQQISEALFISLHTVKSHARRINHKLGVARRTQAVAQGKLLGLLG
ncbi:transcriptional regulator [Halopseudomonas salina]|uniref:Transcriptional regulator n=1 Tax=Halopseudomonas salina TaxID=1323744 RepID=A0ABQ1PW79_9GAMM|nr:LuxR C-terminal-related transcriptional regulator [Halopseudomonas salina]GGD05684.1 transcriptional regulator [Halopseudomonas salina]